MSRRVCKYQRWERFEAGEYGGLSDGYENPHGECGECMACIEDQDRECEAERAADAMELREQDHTAGRV